MKMPAWGRRLRGRSEWIAPLRRRAVALIAAGAPALVAGAQYANPAGVALIIGNTDYEHRDVPDVIRLLRFTLDEEKATIVGDGRG